MAASIFIHHTKNVYKRVQSDRLSLVAAGVAFFIFLSIFPALASVISLYGLIADPDDVRAHINSFAHLLPAEVLSLLEQHIVRFASSAEQKLGLGLFVGLLISLWSANKAMKAVAQALNIAYDVKEDRNFIKVNLITLGLTFLSSIVFTFALISLIVVPVLVSAILSHARLEWLILIVSWFLLFCAILGIFTVLYRKAPALHNRISSRQLLPGALFSTVLLMLGSALFSLYIINFGKYDAQYGSLASVVVTMLWLYLGAFIFLLGAEINAVKRTYRDERTHRVEYA